MYTEDKLVEVKMISKETKDEGNVPITIWCSFFNYGLGFFGILLIILFSSIATFFNVIISYIVAVWAEKDKDEQQDPKYFNMFWGSILIFVVFTTVRVGTVYMCLLLSSINIHKKMTWKLLRAPSAFFDANPIGRILTRFAKDTAVLDYFLGFILNMATVTIFKVLGIYVMIIISVPWMALTLIINFVSVYFIRKR